MEIIWRLKNFRIRSVRLTTESIDYRKLWYHFSRLGIRKKSAPEFSFLDELAFKGLLNTFTVHILRPEAILTSHIDDLFKSLNDVLERATPDLVKLNYTAMNTWSAANHEQK